MEKTESHVLELRTFICKLSAIERKTEVKNIQKGKFKDNDGERMLDIEMEAGEKTITEASYVLTLINSKEGKSLEIPMTVEEFAIYREFLGRTVSQFIGY